MNKNAPVQTEAPVIDYGWKSEFVAKPAPGAVERDLTQATLVLDETNSMNETFHWEVHPGESAEHIQTRASSHPDTKSASPVFVKMILNPFYNVDKPQEKA